MQLFNHEGLVLGSTDPFGLFLYRQPQAARSTHTYVVGLTGKGKSKLLEHLLYQDIVAGRGCGLLDPHSDLANDTLRYLASHSQKGTQHFPRIVYFEPTRSDYFVPFNILSSGFSPYETAQNIVEAFKRTWPKSLLEAPRFANIALVGILTLIANQLTLVDLPRLLTNKDFRTQAVRNLSDPELLSFWTDRYERWGREQPIMIESVLNKVTAFSLNPYVRLTLGAEKNALNFKEIMEDGKVLLVDLGRCDGETRRLLGSLIVTGLEQAALSRQAGDGKRAPFHFYIDEFQDFSANEGSAKTLSQILSECRKFGLHLTLAHQMLSQLSPAVQAALGNIQTKVVFGVDREDAEIMAKRLFGVRDDEVKHMVPDKEQQERIHPLFYTLGEQWEKVVSYLQNLPARKVLVKAPGKGVAELRTITVKDRKCDDVALKKLQKALAKQSGEPVPLAIDEPVRKPRPLSQHIVDWEEIVEISTEGIVIEADRQREGYQNGERG